MAMIAQKHGFLLQFFTFLFVIIIVEIVAASLGYIYKAKVKRLSIFSLMAEFVVYN